MIKNAHTLFLIFVSTFAFASEFINKSQINGHIRSYDFNNTFEKSGNPSNNAASLGGALNILSGPFFSNEFKLGGSLYSAQPIGTNSDNHLHVFKALPSFPVTTLGQTYLQYQHKDLLIRAGNQLINTPWLNAADSYMIPATYQGLYAAYSSWQNITLTALRIFRFKSRTASSFSPTNLYNPENLSPSGIQAFGSTNDQGALAFGSNFKKNSLDSQLWYYQFYNIAKLVYGEAKYSFRQTTFVVPYVGIQALHEWGDGKNMLMPYLHTHPHASGIGTQAGLKIYQADFSLEYDNLTKNNASTKSGGLVSPYTTGYRSDPLYTTSMNAGLVEAGPGHAFKINGHYVTNNQHWIFSSSYARYFISTASSHMDEIDLDGIYALDGKFKGLSLRDRVGVLNGNKKLGRVVNNRLMIQYTF